MMIRTFVMIVALILSVSAFATESVSAAPQDRECGLIFGASDWRMVRDVQAAEITKELLSKAGIVATPVICTGNSDPFVFLQAQMKQRGSEKFFFVAFDESFRQALTTDVRAAVAIEIARVMPGAGTSCDVHLKVRDAAAYNACEHANDVRAARLVGHDSVDRMLRALHHYVLVKLMDIHGGKADRLMMRLHGRIILLNRKTPTNS